MRSGESVLNVLDPGLPGTLHGHAVIDGSEETGLSAGGEARGELESCPPYITAVKPYDQRVAVAGSVANVQTGERQRTCTVVQRLVEVTNMARWLAEPAGVSW
jgi:hypothetical protein